MSNQLPQVLIKNSYNILGLSTAATLKEIRQRSQQLLQLAKIEEIQEFDTDIGNIREFRNESEVRLALERIFGIKDRLREVFFYFDDHNKENQKVVSLIARGNYQKAIDALDKTDKASLDWLGYKNLALALLFQAFGSDDLNSFCRSCELWKHIVESEDFWKFYEKHYLLHDELGTSSSLFQEFRSEIYEYLSAQTVSLYHQTKDSTVVGVYYSTFGLIGKSIDVEVLRPIVLKIKKEMADLEKIASEEDSSEDLLIKALKKIHKYFLELDKFKVLEYSPLTILKNDSAEKLRSLSIDIYNQGDNSGLAQLFLDQSAMLAVSDSIVRTIEADIEQLKNNEWYSLWETVSERFEKVKELILNQKIRDAHKMYLKLDDELGDYDDESSRRVRVHLLIEFCSDFMAKGHELFNKKVFGMDTPLNSLLYWKNQRDAIYVFEIAYEIMMKRLYLLSHINTSLDIQGITDVITGAASALKNCEVTSLSDSYRNYDNQIKEIANSQKYISVQNTIVLLGQSACDGMLYRRLRAAIYIRMGKTIGWVVCMVFLIFMRTVSKSSSSSLNKEEKEAIEYLQKNKPDLLNEIRKEGHSDKEIAQYVIEHADDEEEEK